MLNLPIFGKKKLRLAFEYGAMISDVAKQENVELTAEIMERAEKIMVSEFAKCTPYELTRDMAQNILAVFEPEN